MSERGTWVTEHIYCAECVVRFQQWLDDTHCGNDGSKYWSYVKNGEWSFAGKISGLYSGEEIHDWDGFEEDLKKLLCHPMRIAVLAGEDEKIYNIGGERTTRKPYP